jgi:glycerol-3-phosphate dehydrogenase
LPPTWRAAADGGDAGGERRQARRRAGAGDRLGDFRPYHSTDVRGVEIGGAAKNVLAIAAGIVAGRGLGASARRR